MKWGHAGSFSVQLQVHHMWGKNLDRTHIVILLGKIPESTDQLV